MPHITAKEQRLINTVLSFKGEKRLSDIAPIIGYSLKYLSRIFKEGYGCGYREYVDKRRMQKATVLLRDHIRNLYIKQIARELGYKNPESFIRLFQRKTGKTPGRYRRGWGKK